MEAKEYHDEMEALDTETVTPSLLTYLTNGGKVPKWTTDPRASIFPFKTVYIVDALLSCLLVADPRFVVSRELLWSHLRAGLVTEVFEKAVNVKANLGDHDAYMKQQPRGSQQQSTRDPEKKNTRPGKGQRQRQAKAKALTAADTSRPEKRKRDEADAAGANPKDTPPPDKNRKVEYTHCQECKKAVPKGVNGGKSFFPWCGDCKRKLGK